MKFSNSIIFIKISLKKNIEIVQLLLKNKKLDINISNKSAKLNKKMNDMISMTPLLFAIDQNEVSIIQLFLSRELSSKIDINERSMKTTNGNKNFVQTALYFSIEKQNITAIKLLLARPDINVNEQSLGFQGETLIQKKASLYLAVKIGNLEIIRFLLAKKHININIEDEIGKKPIDYAKIKKSNNFFQNDFQLINWRRKDGFFMPRWKIKNKIIFFLKNWNTEMIFIIFY